MIPEFILETVFDRLDDGVYYASTKGQDGWVVYWTADNETFHTYRYPPDWYES